MNSLSQTMSNIPSLLPPVKGMLTTEALFSGVGAAIGAVTALVRGSDLITGAGYGAACGTAVAALTVAGVTITTASKSTQKIHDTVRYEITPISTAPSKLPSLSTVLKTATAVAVIIATATGKSLQPSISDYSSLGELETGTLEVQKAKLRGLALQLAELKGTLSEDADIESYLKIPLTEAAKFGLRIRGRKTGSMTEVENYSEQTHDLQFRGAYVQVLAFFERLTNLQKIIRVEGFHFKPVGHQLAKAVELEGKIVIKTYNYKPTKADALGTSPPEATSGAVNAPSSTTPEKGNEKGTH